MRTSVVAAVFAASIVVLAGCGQPAANTAEKEDPATVTEVEGQEQLHRITLTERAARRLGIETAEVDGAPGSTFRTRVPYSAIIYDAQGEAWMYVVDGAPLVFIREPVTIVEIVSDAAGDYAVLSRGPAAGTSIVSVGVAELFGTEFEVGH